MSRKLGDITKGVHVLKTRWDFIKRAICGDAGSAASTLAVCMKTDFLVLSPNSSLWQPNMHCHADFYGIALQHLSFTPSFVTHLAVSLFRYHPVDQPGGNHHALFPYTSTKWREAKIMSK